MTLGLVVELTAREDSIDELRERLLAVVTPSRGEHGCLRYDLHETTDDPLRLTFVEEWTSAEALVAHDGSAWVQDLREHLPRLLAGERRVQLQRLEP